MRDPGRAPPHRGLEGGISEVPSCGGRFARSAGEGPNGGVTWGVGAPEKWPEIQGCNWGDSHDP